MQSFQCQCGNKLFFHSTHCLGCNRQTGFCDFCRQTTSVDGDVNEVLTCNQPNCSADVVFCRNFEPHGVCNRLISAKAPATTNEKHVGLCDFCKLTTVIPDLAIAGNAEKWRRLEKAKQRVLYALDTLGFPFRDDANSPFPAVRFEFKADGVEPVSTGHNNGCIVINIEEADSVKRELSRVQLGEPQRTLVGHFRHEMGHYFWSRLVNPNNQLLKQFRELYGDELSLEYGQAIDAYYRNGPAGVWQTNYVSAYATMHPWEDFAETFATYVDMCSVLNTANHFGTADVVFDDLDTMVESYSKIGVMANEFNRDMGLLDLVPEVFTSPVIEKLRFVHCLR